MRPFTLRSIQFTIPKDEFDERPLFDDQLEFTNMLAGRGRSMSGLTRIAVMIMDHPVFPKAIDKLHDHFGIARLLLFTTHGLLGLIDPKNITRVANVGLAYFESPRQLSQDLLFSSLKLI